MIDIMFIVYGAAAMVMVIGSVYLSDHHTSYVLRAELKNEENT